MVWEGDDGGGRVMVVWEGDDGDGRVMVGMGG